MDLDREIVTACMRAINAQAAGRARLNQSGIKCQMEIASTAKVELVACRRGNSAPAAANLTSHLEQCSLLALAQAGADFPPYWPIQES